MKKADFDMLNERIDLIERLLKLLVVNSMVDDLEKSCYNEDKKDSDNTANSSKGSTGLFSGILRATEAMDLLTGNTKKPTSEYEFSNLLNHYNMEKVSEQRFGNISVVYIKSKEKQRSTIYCQLNQIAKESFKNTTIVFVFEIMTNTQKQYFVENNISFCEANKEIHICDNYRKRI